MEPKVINELLVQSNQREWKYDQQLSIINQSGSGNNWAMGYNHFGPKTEREFIDKFNKLRERMEYLDGVMII